MIQEGLTFCAFKTAYGIYQCTYESLGYWFQTPEVREATMAMAPDC